MPMGVTTYAVGVVLSVGTFVAFQIAVWTTSTGKCGLAAWVRRRPVLAGTSAALLAGLVLAVANLDAVLAPAAWSPRYFIPRQPKNDNYLMVSETGELSHDGRWLLVRARFASYGEETFSEPRLYSLAGAQPEPIPWPVHGQGKIVRAAFHYAEDRVAYVRSTPTNDPSIRHEFSVLDLATMTETSLGEPVVREHLFEMKWLPVGSLWLDCTRGQMYVSPIRGKGWVARQVDRPLVYYDVRAGHALDVNAGGVRLLDLQT